MHIMGVWFHVSLPENAACRAQRVQRAERNKTLHWRLSAPRFYLKFIFARYVKFSMRLRQLQQFWTNEFKRLIDLVGKI